MYMRSLIFQCILIINLLIRLIRQVLALIGIEPLQGKLFKKPMALSSLTLQDKVEQLQMSIFLVLEKAEKFLVLKS